MGWILVIVALLLEVVHFATTRDSSLAFIALVLVTLSILLEAVPAAWVRRPGP